MDRAQLMTLTAPEMTVLVGGMRALNANFGQSQHGVFTKRPGTLTDDFFVNLSTWARHGRSRRRRRLRGTRSRNGELKWTGARVDLVFGSTW